jgi:hypothetical protein
MVNEALSSCTVQNRVGCLFCLIMVSIDSEISGRYTLKFV